MRGGWGLLLVVLLVGWALMTLLVIGLLDVYGWLMDEPL